MDATIGSWNDVAALATAFGILLAAVGLWMQADTARASFEDEFTREYRTIMRNIPTKALLGAELTPDERRETFQHFYHYFDLCNEQIYKKRKISPATWRDWEDGIRGNLERKTEFKQAWSYVAHVTSDQVFESLRKLCPPIPHTEAARYLQ